MNKDHQIWIIYDDHVWIRVVGQQTMSARTHARPCQNRKSVDHVYKDMWNTMFADHDSKRHVADHVSKYTWHNQMMTCVKRKLAHAMSTHDVNKLRHSRRITSRVSPPRNVKSLKVPKDEGSKSLSVVDLRYPLDTILTTIRSRRRTCAT
jgi:hypothetical protein